MYFPYIYVCSTVFQANNQEHIKALYSRREFTGDRWIPLKKASSAESVFMSRHHRIFIDSDWLIKLRVLHLTGLIYDSMSIWYLPIKCRQFLKIDTITINSTGNISLKWIEELLTPLAQHNEDCLGHFTYCSETAGNENGVFYRTDWSFHCG